MPSGRTADFSYTDSNNPRAGRLNRREASGQKVVPSWSDGRPIDPRAPLRRPISPPVPERRPVELEAHGDVRIDDWFWLRDKDDPEVIDHLEAENAYTEAAMAGTSRLRDALFDEIVARIEETDLSVPVRKGPWLYYSRTVEGQQLRHPLPAPGRRGSRRDTAGRRPGPRGTHEAAPEGEQVLLDENVLAEGHDYFALGNLEVSPDHRWLAYSTDTTGRRALHHALPRPGHREPSRPSRSRTPRTGWPGPTTTPPSSSSGSTRPCAPTSCGATGSAPTRHGDVLVYEEPDDRFYLGVGPDQGRPVHPVGPGLEGDLRGPGPARRRPARRRSRSSSPAARGSSTASTTTVAIRPADGTVGSSS